MTSSHSQDKVEDTLDPDQIGTKKSTYRYEYKNEMVVFYFKHAKIPI